MNVRFKFDFTSSAGCFLELIYWYLRIQASYILVCMTLVGLFPYILMG
jgi:hypothetical protein